jgi:hypothetical protein
MNQGIDLRLSQVHADHAARRAEAARQRLGRAARAHGPRNPLRRTIGRSLIRLGHALAAEAVEAAEPTLQPARPR